MQIVQIPPRRSKSHGIEIVYRDPQTLPYRHMHLSDIGRVPLQDSPQILNNTYEKNRKEEQKLNLEREISSASGYQSGSAGSLGGNMGIYHKPEGFEIPD